MFFITSVCFLDHSGSVLKPYEFKMEEIEGFRYRCRVSVVCPLEEYMVLLHCIDFLSVCLGFLFNLTGF